MSNPSFETANRIARHPRYEALVGALVRNPASNPEDPVCARILAGMAPWYATWAPVLDDDGAVGCLLELYRRSLQRRAPASQYVGGAATFLALTEELRPSANCQELPAFYLMPLGEAVAGVLLASWAKEDALVAP